MTDKKTYGWSKAGVEFTQRSWRRWPRRSRPVWTSPGSGDVWVARHGVRRRRHPPVRLDPKLCQAVDDRAAAEQTTASDVVREALRRYLKVG